VKDGGRDKSVRKLDSSPKRMWSCNSNKATMPVETLMVTGMKMVRRTGTKQVEHRSLQLQLQLHMYGYISVSYLHVKHREATGESHHTDGLSSGNYTAGNTIGKANLKRSVYRCVKHVVYVL
jgi:hypothetical protein